MVEQTGRIRRYVSKVRLYFEPVLEEIDMQKIKPERSMGDMPDDEVAVINRLQFDEMQKQLGPGPTNILPHTMCT